MRSTGMASSVFGLSSLRVSLEQCSGLIWGSECEFWNFSLLSALLWITPATKNNGIRQTKGNECMKTIQTNSRPLWSWNAMWINRSSAILWLWFCGVTLLPLSVCAAAAAAPGPGEVRDIGSRLELFVDDYLIESMNGVGLKLHAPKRENVAIRFDDLWDGATSHIVSVFQDGEIYRMYYRGGPVHANGVLDNSRTCYAESKDGIHWFKPKLGLYRDEHTESTNNNIVLMRSTQWHHACDNLAVFKDGRPDCLPEARYKAVGRTIKGELGREESAEGFGAAQAGNLAFQSADGLHWRPMRKGPVVVGDGFDSFNIAFWDAHAGCYREYHREFHNGYRDMMTSTSKDFLHWTKPQWVDYKGAQQEHIYQGQILPYYRAPHILFAFAERFVPDRKVQRSHPAEGISEGIFMSSRDGIRFDRRFMQGWIRPGLDPRDWMHSGTSPAWGLLQTGPTELSVYWIQNYYSVLAGKTYNSGTCYLQRGSLRLDGFVSVHAGYAGGEFVTKPIRFVGQELIVNLSTSIIGSLRVEIRDEADEPLPGFTLADCPEMFGDAIERVVKWQGSRDVSALAGQTVRLRMRLKDADLYSIRFRP